MFKNKEIVKSLLAKTALVLLSTLFTFGAFDLTVYLLPRHLLPGPLRNLVVLMEGDTYYVKDPPIGNMIRPQTDYFFPGEEFRFRIQTRLNFPSAGFRGGTLGGPAWGAAFGDSFTFGAGVDQEATWVAQLARLTNREVINFGVPGHGPHQYTRILQKYGVQLRPKVVFYAIFSNDLRDGVRFEAPPPNRSQRMTAKEFITRYSASYNIINNVSRSLKNRATNDRHNTIGLKLLDRRLRDPYAIADQKFASAWAGIAKQIEDAHQESKRRNVTFILLYFPQKEEVYWELAQERIKSTNVFKERVERLNKTIAAFCGARELLCLDLTPPLKARGLRGETFYFPVDIHWNEKGHSLVAQVIYKFLLEKKLI